MNTLTPTLSFLVEYLDLPEAVGDPEAKWETFQLKHLNNPSLLAIELKARQVGWSWLAAAESVASACLYPRTPHVFVSINQDEAAEKIRYAMQIIDALDADVRPRLIKANTEYLELQNGSRLISHPSKPVRGKARTRIYLDEFAHYPYDKEIYQSALPAITKGGFIRIGSSPLGARGVFWEIYTESLRTYPGYKRDSIPWWVVETHCKDVKTARMLAPDMPTEDRVKRFATDRLVQIFDNVTLDDFQQEYECYWLDETISWIDWELIKRNQQLDAQGKLIKFRARGVDQALAAIDDCKRMSVDGHIEQAFCGGMDVGRKRDTTEIILTGKNPHVNQLPYRLHITLDRVEFEEQKAVATKLLHTLPVTRFLIDRNGIGMELAEKLEQVSPAAEGVDFSTVTKELWAVEAKLRAQRGEVPIPLDRDFSYQIHSIKRKPTTGKSSSYDNDRSEKHHADMFWAWALALWAGKEDGQTVVVSGNPLSGYRG